MDSTLFGVAGNLRALFTVNWAEATIDPDEDFRAYVAHRSPALLRTGYLLTGATRLAHKYLTTSLCRLTDLQREAGTPTTTR